MAKFQKGDPKPEASGRVAGTPNKATAEIKEAARQHGPKMIALFATIANNPKKPDQVRMIAAKELLDRGYGKAVQPLGTDPDEPITVVLKKFVFEGEGGEGGQSGAPAG